MNRLMRMPAGRPVTRRTHAALPAEADASAPAIALDQPPAHAAPVSCDQVIFTSIRTPRGEGYHIVAHSPSVSYDERAEITRRSPSHGSLARAEDDAVGMLAYPLASGRLAVAHCVYAGTEHTARGGQRVWTHYAVLDPDRFAEFGNNPFRVQRALAAVAQPGGAPPQALAQLALPAWDRTDIPQHVSDARHGDSFIRLVDACIRGGRWAISGIEQPARSGEWALEMLPPDARSAVSLSYGLAFCLGRELALTFVDCVRGGIDRMIRGHNVTLRDVTADATLDDAYAPWYELLHTWTPKKRWDRISRFTAHMSGPTDPRRLARVAQLSLDIDAAEFADEETKAALREKYADFAAYGQLEAHLLDELQEAIAPSVEPSDAQPSDDRLGGSNAAGVFINDGGRLS